MKSKPRVYVVNYMGHDMSDALRFTDKPLVYLTQGPVPFDNRTLYSMAEKLRDFQPEDFLLVSGSAVLAAMAVAILKETNDVENINVLIYHPREHAYMPERINGYVELPPRA